MKLVGTICKFDRTAGFLDFWQTVQRNLQIANSAGQSGIGRLDGTETSRFRQRAVLLSYIYMAKYLSPDIVGKLYKDYIRPVVEYASPLWHSHLTAHQSITLGRLQVRVSWQLLARLGVNLPDGYRTSKSDLLERVNWPSLTWLRHIDNMRLFHHFFPPASHLGFVIVIIIIIIIIINPRWPWPIRMNLEYMNCC